MNLGVELLFLLFVVVVFGAVGVGYWLTRYRPKCPQCGQRHATQVDKTVHETRQVVQNDGNNSWGAGGMMLETVYRVRFRCQSCGHVWDEREVE